MFHISHKHTHLTILSVTCKEPITVTKHYEIYIDKI